jgi:hypothetical protein
MSDLERQLSVLLAERVDSVVGPRRTPPAFDPEHRTVYPAVDRPATARAVLIAVVAAACVVAVVLGTVGLSRLSSDRAPTPPLQTTPAPTVTPPAPTSTTSATQTPTGTPTGVAPAGPTATMAGARLVLPRGWVARAYGDYSPGGVDNYWLPSALCLTPASLRVVVATSTRQDNCPVVFGSTNVSALHPQSVDSDTDGGLSSDPHECGMGPMTWSIIAETRSFGGRAADYRQWHIVCTSTGRVVEVAQYVVPTDRFFSLYARHATSDVVRAMSQIASAATLPAQSEPVRLYDVGYVRGARHLTGGGVRSEIDRVVPPGRGWANNSHRTYA